MSISWHVEHIPEHNLYFIRGYGSGKSYEARNEIDVGLTVLLLPNKEAKGCLMISKIKLTREDRESLKHLLYKYGIDFLHAERHGRYIKWKTF